MNQSEASQTTGRYYYCIFDYYLTGSKKCKRCFQIMCFFENAAGTSAKLVCAE